MRYFWTALAIIGSSNLGFVQAFRGTQTSLQLALEVYDQLTTFAGILAQNPRLFDLVINPNTTSNITVLAPTNDAITTFLQTAGVNKLDEIPTADLYALLQYHVLDAPMTSANLSLPHGITVPTTLRDSQFDNRTAGPQITNLFGPGATGQVVFVSQKAVTGITRLKARKTLSGSPLNIRGGLGDTGGLTAIDGTWDGGYFQAVDRCLFINHILIPFIMFPLLDIRFIFRPLISNSLLLRHFLGF